MAEKLTALGYQRALEKLDEGAEAVLAEGAQSAAAAGAAALAARTRILLAEIHTSQGGVEDISNAMGAYTVVRADSHEAAAKLFEDHPHFAIFPGESVEIMPVLPIPGA